MSVLVVIKFSGLGKGKMSSLLNKTHLHTLAQGGYVDCKLTHGGLECYEDLLARLLKVFRQGISVTTPLHIFPLILQLQSIFKQPFSVLYTLLQKIVRSSLFLACQVSLARYAFCWISTITQSMGPGTVAASSLVGNFSIFIEEPGRRYEYLLYLMPRILDSITSLLQKRGLFFRLPLGEILLFGLGMAALIFSIKLQTKQERPSYSGLTGLVFGVN